jgi:hypothetical protein
MEARDAVLEFNFVNDANLGEHLQVLMNYWEPNSLGCIANIISKSLYVDMD